jgi:predicted nucleic acid-binding protein
VRGTLGVLVDARRAGHSPSLRATLDELRAQGFRVAPTLVSEALRHVGEE